MIKNLPLNSDNFLRFYSATSPILSTSQYYNGLVNGYQYRWRTFDTPLPIIVGDTLQFYTNFESNLFDSTTQSIKIIEGETIINEPLRFSLVIEAVGLENNRIILNIPSTNNIEREFRLAIVNNSDNQIVNISNCFKVLKQTERNLNNTHLLSFKHNANIYNYEWQALGEFDPDYIVRVPSSILEFSYPKEDAVYKSATSGKPRKTRTILSKAYQFETYYLDEDGHDAVNLAVNLEKFLINGEEFIADGAYEVDFQQLTNIHKGSINLLLKRYGARISNCVTPPPPPVAPVMNYTLFEIDQGFQVDLNLRPLVNEVALTPLFGDAETGTATLEQGDQVEIRYNHQGGFYDVEVTSASTQITIAENGVEVVNIITPIPDLDADFVLSSFFTAQNDVVYDIVTRIIVTGFTT